MDGARRANSLKNAQWALTCGASFQGLAERLIPGIASLPEQSSGGPAPSKVGDLVACATNLGFALELYLKALLVHLECDVPRTHNLANLYQALPDEIRNLVENVYDAAWRAHLSPGERVSVTLAKGPLDPPLWGPPASPALGELLKRSENLFQGWRYAFEFSRPPESLYELHTFEYGHLWWAAEALKAEASVRLQRA